MDVWTPYYGQYCCPTTQIQKCLQQGHAANLYWLSVWKMVLLCIFSAVHITVCVMCLMRLIGHIIHGIQQLLDAFTGITTFSSASCAIQSLSDPIHRLVTTHALSKGDRLQYAWSRPFLSTQTDPTVLLKVAGDGWGSSRPWVKSGLLRENKNGSFWLRFGLKIRGDSIRRATVGIIAHVRYIKILTWLQGFLVIFLYPVWFSFSSSLLWKLWDNRVVKKLQFCR